MHRSCPAADCTALCSQPGLSGGSRKAQDPGTLSAAGLSSRPMLAPGHNGDSCQPPVARTASCPGLGTVQPWVLVLQGSPAQRCLHRAALWLAAPGLAHSGAGRRVRVPVCGMLWAAACKQGWMRPAQLGIAPRHAVTGGAGGWPGTQDRVTSPACVPACCSALRCSPALAVLWLEA